MNRRQFLTAVGGTAILSVANGASSPTIKPHEIGITTASFDLQSRSKEPDEHIPLTDIPRIVRDELGLRLIDINTSTLGSYDPSHVARFRKSIEAAGCFVTNLKINIPASFVDDDETLRKRALAEYREWIKAAAALGARWARPIPARTRPSWDRLVEGYNILCDFAEPLGIRLLAENYRWVESDPSAIPELIKRLNGRISAQPDTLNWTDHPTRLAGLAAAFPQAASCDFKLKELTADGQHPAFNLKECFNLGVKSGFRGPWCIEHINKNRVRLFQEHRQIIAMLGGWSRDLQ